MRTTKIIVLAILMSGFATSVSAVDKCVDPDERDPDDSSDWYDMTAECPLLDSASWDVSNSFNGGSLSATAELDWSNPTPERYYGNDIIIGNQDMFLQANVGVYDCNGGSAENYRTVYPWSFGWGGGGFDADGTYTHDISFNVNEGDGVHYVALNVALDSGSPGPDGARTTPSFHEQAALVTNTGTSCAPSNNPPNADITANTTEVMEGGTVEFDPSGSNDVDGSISEYWFQWPDNSGIQKSSPATETYTFNTPGTRTVELEVTDDDGATDSTTIDITVNEGCDFSILRPEAKSAVQGEDTHFSVYHNDATNCPSASDMKLDVCGTNLTTADGLYETSNYYTSTLQTAFNVSFNTETDVSCSGAYNPVQFYDGDEPVGGEYAYLSLTREQSFGAPIHDNGDYKPDSEIIVATEMSHPRTDFYDLSSQNVADMEDTFFFACRGDYRGTDISDSQLVKVQEGSLGAYRWQHYRCAMNGTWREVNCDPGMELVRDPSGSFQCQLRPPRTIEATYFNILDVPYSGRENGYIAGFKIPDAEIAKYEQVMGFEPEEVDAECWMGEDDERPTSSGDAVMFTSTYEGGDLWALGNIPGRDGVNNETYSCVWGMKNVGSTADTNVYESTNNNPLLARDGGKQDITYNNIESRYTAADISEGTPRDVWQDYKSKSDTAEGQDERSYISGTDEFMLDNEVPYCSSNAYWSSTSSVLSNIICS